jgi:hypothetical protein
MPFRRLALAGLMLALAAVLSGCGEDIRAERERENAGDVLRGDLTVAIRSAEQVLSSMGYQVDRKPTYKGPDQAGVEITGDHEQDVKVDEAGQAVAKNVLFGVLGAASVGTITTPSAGHVPVSKGEIIQVYLSRRWDGAYDKAQPDVTTAMVRGNTYTRDLKGKYYDKQDLDALRMDQLRDKIQASIVATYRAYHRKI